MRLRLCERRVYLARQVLDQLERGVKLIHCAAIMRMAVGRSGSRRVDAEFLAVIDRALDQPPSRCRAARLATAMRALIAEAGRPSGDASPLRRAMRAAHEFWPAWQLK